jgi:hypothetical protein
MERLDCLPSKVQKVSVPPPVSTGMDSNTSPAASFDFVETMAVIGRRESSLEPPLSISLMFSVLPLLLECPALLSRLLQASPQS